MPTLSKGRQSGSVEQSEGRPSRTQLLNQLKKGSGFCERGVTSLSWRGSKLWTWMRLVLPMPEKETVYRLVRGGQQ